MVFPCERCSKLKRSCVKLEGSSRCSECVKAGNCKCVDSKVSFSDSEWRRLVDAQNKIEEDEEQLLSKLLRLRKQKRLLHKRAGDFIARDYKEIKELEVLEEEEKQKQKETETRQVEINRVLGVSSSSAHIDAALSPSVFDVSSFDPVAFDQFLAGIPESSQGS